MSISSTINDFLDKSVEARFKRDAQGRLVFFPFGFGSGRIVPDAASEAVLRLGCRRLMIAIFVVVIPVVSAAAGIFQLKGATYVQFLAACIALGFATQLYPAWLARGLPRSGERLSYVGASLHSLENFSRKFKIFGLVTSVIFSAVAAFALAYPPARAEIDPTAMIFSLIIFAPLAAIYATSLFRKERQP